MGNNKTKEVESFFYSKPFSENSLLYYEKGFTYLNFIMTDFQSLRDTYFTLNNTI